MSLFWPILFPALALGGCALAGDCSDRLLETKYDLEGPLAAYKLVRNCGATTGYATLIAIGDRARGAKAATTVFVADASPSGRTAEEKRLAPGGPIISEEDQLDASVDVEGNAVWTEMHWTAPHRLSIAYAEKARVFSKMPETAGARIAYRATNRLTLPPVP